MIKKQPVKSFGGGKMSKKMTFEQNRKALLIQMTSKTKAKTEERIIQFRNQDVPEFLKSLDEFEEKSRKSSIIVK
jgi:hypothetical protein